MGNLEPLARTYPAGVTCWVDLTTYDVAGAAEFYRGLFGWELEDRLPPDGPQRFLLATLDGLDVASISSPTDGDPTWATYVAVDDLEDTARRMFDLGATVVEAAEAVGPAGTAATMADPQGAVFRLWKPGLRLGAQLINAPGSWNFSDLHTPDPGLAAAFYGQAFGWAVVDQGWAMAIQVPGYGDHLEATVDPDIRTRQASAPDGFEDVIGGMVATTEGEPAHWHVTFSVADRDASAAKAEELGGSVLGRDEDDWSKKAVVRDAQGAVFTISQFAPPSGWA